MLTKKEIAFIILTKKQRIYWLSNQEYISLQKLFLNKEMKETIEMLANRIENIVINIYKHLHQHPELSFAEKETAAFIEEILQGENIPYRKNIGGYGILARIEGKNPTPRIIGLRADMDALLIEEGNNVPFRSVNPHVMHACGHDAHTACLLGAAMILNRIREIIEGTVLLIFQPGEEKAPGGANLMLQEGIFDDIKPDIMIAQHTNTDIACGDVAFGSGCVMASADEIHLTIRGKGGHGAMPHHINDTVLAASQIVVSLQQIISRRRNPFVPAVLTFGRFIADGATNIIPDQVSLSGTFRCMDEKERIRLKELIQNTIKATAEAYGCSCDIHIPDGYPAVVNDPVVTESAKKFAEELLGDNHVGEMEKRMTSEDFGFFAERIPSTFYRLGVKGPSNPECGEQHTAHFLIDESALKTGVKMLAWLSLRFLDKNIRIR